MSLPSDWEGIEKLPGMRWAPLPPTSLKNCLPNGDCFARQGSATVGDRNMTVVATGARTMVFHLLFRNMSAPLGEPAVVAALEQAGLTADLVRCPIKSGTGGTNWYRLKGAGLTPGHLSIQPARAGRQLRRDSWRSTWAAGPSPRARARSSRRSPSSQR